MLKVTSSQRPLIVNCTGCATRLQLDEWAIRLKYTTLGGREPDRPCRYRAAAFCGGSSFGWIL